MITLSPLRWGKPYDSLEFNDVVHFDTGEPIAKVGTVGGGIVGRDLKKAGKAREALLQLS
ncbi:MAG: aldehyde dehydrogenase, partial [Planctomycetota bacterium]